MGKNRKDLAGLYFGNLKVLFYYDTYKPFTTSRSRWLCECMCGNILVVEAKRLLAGNAYSCGCGIPKIQKHGMAKTRLYKNWQNIKGNKIGICEEWLDFLVFFKWSMDNGYTDTLYLRRLDENDTYKPDNCEWSTTYKSGPLPFKNTTCVVCDKLLDRHNKKYCSFRCQRELQYQNNIEAWKLGKHDGTSGTYYLASFIRRYLREKYSNSCSLCGWNQVNPHTNKIPLEVEHIDGNHTNNKEDNLLLLCPNCHSLTSTYKGANRGNGRKNRSKYYLPSGKTLKSKQAPVV